MPLLSSVKILGILTLHFLFFLDFKHSDFSFAFFILGFKRSDFAFSFFSLGFRRSTFTSTLFILGFRHSDFAFAFLDRDIQTSPSHYGSDVWTLLASHSPTLQFRRLDFVFYRLGVQTLPLHGPNV